MQSFSGGEPMELMAVDVAGEFHVSRSGNRYILVADYFTKYVSIMAMPDHRAETLASHLVREVFCKVGVPLTLHSSQGTDFLSKLFTQVCKVFHKQKTRTISWRSHGDGMLETIGGMLRQYVNDLQTDWDDFLPLCAMTSGCWVGSSIFL